MYSFVIIMLVLDSTCLYVVFVNMASKNIIADLLTKVKSWMAITIVSDKSNFSMYLKNKRLLKLFTIPWLILGRDVLLNIGEIKELIITAEEGIAKGIRRIIAVTGQEAFRVQVEAKNFAERLDALKRMPYSPEKEAKEKELTVEFKKLVKHPKMFSTNS